MKRWYAKWLLFYYRPDFMIWFVFTLCVSIPTLVTIIICHANEIDNFFYNLLKQIWK